MDGSLQEHVAEIGMQYPVPSAYVTKEIGDIELPKQPTPASQALLTQIEEHGLGTQELQAPEDDALLAIDLRTRLLETVLAGSISSSDAFQHRVSSTDRRTIGTRAEAIVKKLEDVLQAKPNDVVRRFVQSYDLNEPLLHIPNPVNQQAQSVLEKDQHLSAQEKISLVFESEPEITSLEKDLREIDLLNARGFLDAGKLVDCESLKDALQAVLEEVKVLSEALAPLENRATSIISHYDSYVNTLSELFISWDNILTTVEEETIKLERNATSLAE